MQDRSCGLHHGCEAISFIEDRGMRDGVMRGIIAIALAGLLSVTAPVLAADLEVPPLVTKEAPPLPPVAPVAEFDWAPFIAGGIIAAGVIVCVLECAGHHNAAPI